MLGEDGSAILVNFDLPFDSESGTLKSKVKPSNPGKQAADLQISASSRVRHSRFAHQESNRWSGGARYR